MNAKTPQTPMATGSEGMPQPPCQTQKTARNDACASWSAETALEKLVAALREANDEAALRIMESWPKGRGGTPGEWRDALRLFRDPTFRAAAQQAIHEPIAQRGPACSRFVDALIVEILDRPETFENALNSVLAGRLVIEGLLRRQKNPAARKVVEGQARQRCEKIQHFGREGLEELARAFDPASWMSPAGKKSALCAWIDSSPYTSRTQSVSDMESELRAMIATGFVDQRALAEGLRHCCQFSSLGGVGWARASVLAARVEPGSLSEEQWRACLAGARKFAWGSASGWGQPIELMEAKASAAALAKEMESAAQGRPKSERAAEDGPRDDAAARSAAQRKPGGRL
jgi:hypothetical protein